MLHWDKGRRVYADISKNNAANDGGYKRQIDFGSAKGQRISAGNHSGRGAYLLGRSAKSDAVAQWMQEHGWEAYSIEDGYRGFYRWQITQE